MRQRSSFREQFRRGNASSHPDCRATAIALAKREPLPEETLGRLEKATKDIAAIKEQVGVSAADAANDALDRLERHDPAQYQKLLRERKSAK